MDIPKDFQLVYERDSQSNDSFNTLYHVAIYNLLTQHNELLKVKIVSSGTIGYHPSFIAYIFNSKKYKWKKVNETSGNAKLPKGSTIADLVNLSKDTILELLATVY